MSGKNMLSEFFLIEKKTIEIFTIFILKCYGETYD